jgi:hypothetical protein
VSRYRTDGAGTARNADHLRKLLTGGAVDGPAPWWVMQLMQLHLC